MKTRFVIYGLLGWLLEVIWTGIGSLLAGDPRMIGITYLWMFPIYGLAVFLEQVHDVIRERRWWLRGLIWLMIIWGIELTTGGLILSLTGTIPWDYTGKTAWEIGGLIRLDMAPAWFALGLGFERVHDLLDRVEIG